jgi:hypothetical protein
MQFTTRVELREWQEEFLNVLDQHASGIVNLCGGPHGKSWLAHYLQIHYNYDNDFQILHVDEDEYHHETLDQWIDQQRDHRTLLLISTSPLQTVRYHEEMIVYELK